MPRVLNIQKDGRAMAAEPYMYVGRPKGAERWHFGNPFTHRAGTKASVIVSSREEAVRAFSDWLSGFRYQEVEPQRRQWILDNLHLLKGKNLVCWCAPLICHGEILLELANQPVPEELVANHCVNCGALTTCLIDGFCSSRCWKEFQEDHAS